MDSPVSERCPHLRLATGQNWGLPGPSSRHRCFVQRPPERIGADYQQATCLTIGHRQCPRLASLGPAEAGLFDPAASKLRAAPTAQRPPSTGIERAVQGLGVAILLAFLFVVGVVVYRLAVSGGPGMTVPVAQETLPQPTAMVLAAAAETALPQQPAEMAAPVTTAVLPTLSPETSPMTPVGVGGDPEPLTPVADARVPATSPPTRLVIPKIGLDIAVKPVGFKTVRRAGGVRTVWADLPNAGAFHNTSALPGHAGNTVINGHRDIKGSVFRHLDRVEVGDEIELYVGEDRYPYMVSQTLVVPETFASAEQRQKNLQLIGTMPEERLTLITCTPVGLATHRLLVIAKPAGPVIPEMPAAGSDPGP